MEVVGGVASIVGIAQALAATPKIVAAIRAVAERKEELSKLLKEVSRFAISTTRSLPPVIFKLKPNAIILYRSRD